MFGSPIPWRPFSVDWLLIARQAPGSGPVSWRHHLTGFWMHSCFASLLCAGICKYTEPEPVKYMGPRKTAASVWRSLAQFRQINEALDGQDGQDGQLSWLWGEAFSLLVFCDSGARLNKITVTVTVWPWTHPHKRRINDIKENNILTIIWLRHLRQKNEVLDGQDGQMGNFSELIQIKKKERMT